ncbi:MAG: hypothetical protein IPM74_04465 [Crocinitomicaceae bacterium]|nr:hypothetical protein [Crocinitomicaceae bacterium]MBK8925163.1 hypothetical protein [Crocinitomicaceae bacterium]
MIQITHDSINLALDKIDNLSDEQLDQLITTYGEQQEDLLNYVLQAGIDFDNEEINTYSIYYFVVLYESFLQQGLHPEKITEDQINDFQDPFLEALDAINSKDNHKPLQELIGQVALQEFIVEDLEAEDEDGSTLDEEMRSQLFIVSSAIIGLLNEAV